jgi:transposase
MDLTDQQWALVQPLILNAQPPAEVSGSTLDNPVSSLGTRGRPPIDDRLLLDAILWKIRNHAPWYDLLDHYPSHQTVYRRYRLWCRQGLLNKIFLTLYTDLLHRGDFDPQRALHDGSITVVQKESHFRILASIELLGTWQLSTALVFLQIALARLRSNTS